MLPGMLSQLIQVHLCIAKVVEKTSKMGHNIPVPGSFGAPVRSRRSQEVPGMLRGTFKEVQETNQGTHKMKFGHAMASVAPHGFFRLSMRFPRHAQGVETV